MKAGLPKGVSYKLLKHIRLVGILLVVYVRESIMSRISDVSTGSVSTGILGMLGEEISRTTSLIGHFKCLK